MFFVTNFDSLNRLKVFGSLLHVAQRGPLPGFPNDPARPSLALACRMGLSDPLSSANRVSSSTAQTSCAAAQPEWPA